MAESKSFALMELAPGKTLNELAYMNPDVLEENRVRIAFQLGMHTAFSYVFGLKDGYQSNYLFDVNSKTITRVDNEKFLYLPEKPENTLNSNDSYTQAIAACELANLKYIPSSRDKEKVGDVLKAFNTGFLEKYREIKGKRKKLVELIRQTREDTFAVRPDVNENEYVLETKKLMAAVDYLIGQKPEEVLNRLHTARAELK